MKMINHHPRITQRERRVLEMLAQGHTHKQIAAELGITEGTARIHTHNLRRAFKASNTMTLVRNALKASILKNAHLK